MIESQPPRQRFYLLNNAGHGTKWRLRWRRRTWSENRRCWKHWGTENPRSASCSNGHQQSKRYTLTLFLTGLIYAKCCSWVIGCVTGNSSTENRSWQHEDGEPRNFYGLLPPFSISSSSVYQIILSPHRFWNDLNSILNLWEVGV